MGCNVSPYRGGVLKYKETKTVNVTYTDTTTAHDLFTAQKPCIIKVLGSATTNNCFQSLTVNSEQVAASGSYALPCLDVTSAHKKVLSSVGVSSQKGGANGVLLLLETGDALKTKNTYIPAEQSISATFTILVYEFE